MVSRGKSKNSEKNLLHCHFIQIRQCYAKLLDHIQEIPALWLLLTLVTPVSSAVRFLLSRSFVGVPEVVRVLEVGSSDPATFSMNESVVFNRYTVM
jgi:hypothetical protein